jgi:hypothetical protein
MSNRLAAEASPYLRQHADNPVDWYPWGADAFARARGADRPVFLSIGYATCHWCHVMARESFSDSEVADLLNRDFVPVKVDREERPDIDQLYMTACQALTGQGGWPLSVFLTPDGQPFYAGTYFPKNGRMGLPGFIDLLRALDHWWRTDRDRLLRAGREVTALLDSLAGDGRAAELNAAPLARAADVLRRRYDECHGGFGSAPKFPVFPQLAFLLRWRGRGDDETAREMAEKTLVAMHHGGIWDQIGFGLHRYAVDAAWRVPHFEKMLSDQAQFIIALTEAYQVSGRAEFAAAVREVAAYLDRRLAAPGGGFHAAEDADAAGAEGTTYLWTPAEVVAVLGPGDGALACRAFGVTDPGEFHGRSIPWRPQSLHGLAVAEGMKPKELTDTLEDIRRRLLTVRNERLQPAVDDQVLTGWNGLTIAAFARAARVLQDGDMLATAERTAAFLRENLERSDGRLLRRWRHGDAAHLGVLEDYALSAWGFWELYQADSNPAHLDRVKDLLGALDELFWDEPRGCYLQTGRDAEKLVGPTVEIQDGALPAGNSVAADLLLRVGRLTGSGRFSERGEQVLATRLAAVAGHEDVAGHLLGALDFYLGPSREVVLAGPDGPEMEAFRRVLDRRFLPRTVWCRRQPGAAGEELDRLVPGAAAFTATDRPLAVQCDGFVCRRPCTTAAELEAALVEE